MTNSKRETLMSFYINLIKEELIQLLNGNANSDHSKEKKLKLIGRKKPFLKNKWTIINRLVTSENF